MINQFQNFLAIILSNICSLIISLYSFLGTSLTLICGHLKSHSLGIFFLCVLFWTVPMAMLLS